MKNSNLKDMRRMARESGGICLSVEYKNNTIKLKWQCEKGHIWEAIPAAIRQGHWCPECGGTKRLTIEGMKELAEIKGGECLSEEYINAHTKLTWKCKEGHIWEAIPNNIKNYNTWCPECFKLVRGKKKTK